MKKFFNHILLVLVVTFGFSSCDNNQEDETGTSTNLTTKYKSFSASVSPNTYIISVANSLVPCTGVGEQKCMMVKGGDNGEWELFYDTIEGFAFEEGYLYELKVKVESVDNPPADASSLKFILVEELSKTAKEDTSSVSLRYKSFSAAVKTDTYVIQVASSLVPCTGVGEQECMVVKGGDNDEWELFYDTIEGFTFQEGYLYKLKVRVEDVENPPADASSLRFILVEEISKTRED